MKKLFAAVIALCSVAAFGATTLPVQLLNPTGSTSGQAIVSTGASSAPAWASVNAVTLNGATFPAPGPIGGTTASTGVFTNVQVNEPANSPSTVFVNAPSDSNGANVRLTGNGGTTPSKWIRAQGGAFQVMNNGYSSAILQVTDAGDLSAATGLDATPVGSVTPSTGAFTTLSATGTVTIPAGTTITTPNIVGVTNGAASAAGSVGEIITNSATAVSLTTSTPANITSISLTAGDWDVWGNVEFDAAASTVIQTGQTSINTVSAAMLAAPNRGITSGATFAANSVVTVPPPQRTISVASTTTVFLVANLTFVTSTATAAGIITARRRH